jgi:hypothetical protein
MGGEPGNRIRPFLRKRLRTEPLVRAELEAARAWAVPRSVFLGRIVGPGEPAWTEQDRQWAIALLAEEKATHTCGHLIEESFAKENDGRYVGEAIRCHACAAAQRESQEFSEHAEGIYVTARRVDD